MDYSSQITHFLPWLEELSSTYRNWLKESCCKTVATDPSKLVMKIEEYKVLKYLKSYTWSVGGMYSTFGYVNNNTSKGKIILQLRKFLDPETPWIPLTMMPTLEVLYRWAKLSGFRKEMHTNALNLETVQKTVHFPSSQFLMGKRKHMSNNWEEKREERFWLIVDKKRGIWAYSMVRGGHQIGKNTFKKNPRKPNRDSHLDLAAWNRHFNINALLPSAIAIPNMWLFFDKHSPSKSLGIFLDSVNCSTSSEYFVIFEQNCTVYAYARDKNWRRICTYEKLVCAKSFAQTERYYYKEDVLLGIQLGKFPDFYPHHMMPGGVWVADGAALVRTCTLDINRGGGGTEQKTLLLHERMISLILWSNPKSGSPSEIWPM